MELAEGTLSQYLTQSPKQICKCLFHNIIIFLQTILIDSLELAIKMGNANCRGVGFHSSKESDS
jgi:hypothetical protein